MKYKLRLSLITWDPIGKGYHERYVIVKILSQRQVKRILKILKEDKVALRHQGVIGQSKAGERGTMSKGEG